MRYSAFYRETNFSSIFLTTSHKMSPLPQQIVDQLLEDITLDGGIHIADLEYICSRRPDLYRRVHRRALQKFVELLKRKDSRKGTMAQTPTRTPPRGAHAAAANTPRSVSRTPNRTNSRPDPVSTLNWSSTGLSGEECKYLAWMCTYWIFNTMLLTYLLSHD